MAYPFKKVPHCEYNRTFLKDVRVAVGYPAVDASVVNKEQLHSFFSKFKGANIDVDIFLSKKNISLFSNERDVEFLFTLDYAEAKLTTPFYSTFERAMPYWLLLQDYMRALGVTHITGLVERKYSEFSFKSDNDNYKIKDVMSEVFSSDLMDKIPQNTSFKELNSFEKNWYETDEESSTTFNVVFGFKKTDTSIKDDHLTLVTTVERMRNSEAITIENYPTLINRYNEVLFQAFHWCVRGEIINHMNVKKQ